MGYWESVGYWEVLLHIEHYYLKTTMYAGASGGSQEGRVDSCS